MNYENIPYFGLSVLRLISMAFDSLKPDLLVMIHRDLEFEARLLPSFVPILQYPAHLKPTCETEIGRADRFIFALDPHAKRASTVPIYRVWMRQGDTAVPFDVRVPT